jgi:hypothetical protein
MSKITRLMIVLSIAYTAVVYPSLYLYEIKTANEAAYAVWGYCKLHQAQYPNDSEINCIKERNEFYESEVKHINSVTAIFTITSLMFFLLISFGVHKAINWIRKGD